MAPDKDFDFDNVDWSVNDKLFEELSNQPPIEFNFSDENLAKLLEIANQPFPDLSFSDENLNNLLDEMSSADSELNFDWSEADLSVLLQDVEVASIESDAIPEPDPNLTAKDVATWMLTQVETNRRLYQQNAARHIRRYFGERFIYLNENRNPAISREVLNEFLLISLKTVVWNRRERYWRIRQPADPSNRRMVDD